MYKCTFKFEHSANSDLWGSIVTVIGSSIDDFLAGFWITEDLALITGIEGKFWIPPSMIQYIEKL